MSAAATNNATVLRLKSPGSHITDVFGAGGLMSKAFPGYEPRPGQIILSQTIDRAMREGKHVLAEGPCGVGKGLAYLVPAIHQAVTNKKRILIATATIALQEQLIEKDLPSLQTVLPTPFTFALLKGRSNFLCLDRVDDFDPEQSNAYSTDEEIDHARSIASWAKTTERGDKSELNFIPAHRLWNRVAVGPDDCKGKECAYRSDCFYEKAKKTAAESDVVVVNHHLLFANMAFFRSVLPDFDVLVIDEAHDAADIARSFFERKSSEATTTRFVNWGHQHEMDNAALALKREARAFFDEVRGFALGSLPSAAPSKFAQKILITKPESVDPTALIGALNPILAVAIRTQRELERLRRKVLGLDDADGDDDDAFDYDEPMAHEFTQAHREALASARKIARSMSAFRAHLLEVQTLDDENLTHWIEVEEQGRKITLHAKPVDVSHILRDELFGKTESVTLISATLTTDGTFKFVRGETGAPADALETTVDSPFDFEKQAILITPKMPDPKDATFVDAVARTVGQVMDACDGRTLALFTSHRNLNAVADQFRGSRHTIFRQGEAPPRELTKRFKADEHSSLFGTESFWTGVDVPGSSLTAVVIDKLPMPMLDDPILAAIKQRHPKTWFDEYYIPRAIILFRQGVGRLIRARSDIGAIVLLDPRLLTARYGARFLKSLPKMRQSKHVSDIALHLSLAGASTAATGLFPSVPTATAVTAHAPPTSVRGSGPGGRFPRKVSQ